MKYFLLLVLSLLLQLHGWAYTNKLAKRHETVGLQLGVHTGNVQWLKSDDGQQWVALENESGGLLQVAADAPAYYVARVSLNGCQWHSDTTYVYPYDGNTTVADLQAEGFGLAEISGAGFDISYLVDEGYTVEELYRAGADVLKLYQRGIYVGTLRNAGATVAELEQAGLMGTVLDRDGNTYPWVKIGKLLWTTEDLRTLNFDIPAEAEANCNKGDCALVICENEEPVKGFSDVSDEDTVIATLTDKTVVYYGGETAKYACPEGWRLPSDNDFKYIDTITGENKKMYLVNIPVPALYYFNGDIIYSSDYYPELTDMAIPYVAGGMLGLDLSYDAGIFTGNEVVYNDTIKAAQYWTTTMQGNGSKWVRAVKDNIRSFHRYDVGMSRYGSARCVKDGE